jgi:hypothetical protein
MMKLHVEESGPKFKAMRADRIMEELEQAVTKRGYVTLPISFVWNALQVMQAQQMEIERLKGERDAQTNSAG